MALLLAQLGAHAAGRFAERIGPLGLTPAESGLLRVIAADPGCTQQAVAAQLRVQPSRVVVLVDGLEQAGIVERRRDPRDRRNYALHLTGTGQGVLENLGRAAVEHEVDTCAALTDDERAQLVALLQRVADQQGLARGVHPGYSRLGDASREHRRGRPGVTPAGGDRS